MLKQFEETLFSLRDLNYKNFYSKLLPTVNPDTIIGVSTPDLRAVVKRLFKENNTDFLMESLPHKYYEAQSIHAFLIEQIKDFDRCICSTN